MSNLMPPKKMSKKAKKKKGRRALSSGYTSPDLAKGNGEWAVYHRLRPVQVACAARRRCLGREVV